VRGAVILGAFLANYDMRWMNTMDVLICQPTEGCEVKETLSDVGSGLGAAAHAPLFTSNANAADYGPDWISVDRRGNLKLTNFQTNDYNGVIDHLTNDDFKWFARYLEQITPEQYKQALVAAGFTSVEVEIFAQLLAARRDQLVSIR
jgi:hypothetical protein